MEAVEIEFSKLVVIFDQFSFAFVDCYAYTCLVILMGRKSYGLLRWDGGVSLDDVSHDTVGGLDTSGKWGDVEEGNLLGLLAALAEEDGSLDGGAVSDSFVGVDGFVEAFKTEEVDEFGLELWDSGGTTDEDDFGNISFGDTGVLLDLLDDVHAVVEEILDKLLELGSGNVGVVVLTLGESFAGKRGLVYFREEDLGGLAVAFQLSQGFFIL